MIGGVIGGVIGGIAVLVIVILGAGFCFFFHRKSGNRNSKLPKDATMSASTALERLDDDGALIGAEINSSEKNESDMKCSENK